MKSFLRWAFAPTPKKHRKLSSVRLRAEALDPRIVPTVTDPVRQDLADYLHDRMNLRSLTAARAPAVNVALLAPLAPIDPQYEMPLGTKADVKDVLVYDKDPLGVTVPLKVLTITNHNNFTIYPVLRDGNQTKSTSLPEKALYDPFDPKDEEYRGYVGYTQNGKNFFGLPPGKTITIRVPLVFWDGSRMSLGIDGKYMNPDKVGSLVLTVQGLGYTKTPTVKFTGGRLATGTDATAHVDMSGGKVTAIVLDTPGSGYTSAPTITIERGNGDNTGTGAAADALLIPNPFNFFLNNPDSPHDHTKGPTARAIVPALTAGDGGNLLGVTITDPGKNYTSAPTLTFNGGGGTGAAAKATVSGGKITNVTISNFGTGYTSAPTITLTGGGGTGVDNAHPVAILNARINPKPIIPSDPNGVVMWYHSTAIIGIKLDAPDQLTEWTIRDPYLGAANVNPGYPTAKEITVAQQHALINYDVSYVDSMVLPVAMEALDVPEPVEPSSVQGGGRPYTLYPQPYGWTGTKLDAASMQAKINAFTVASTSGLGSYFTDSKGVAQGWPYYILPNSAQIKIPAGQNIFGNSPVKNISSSYNNETYMLSTGGVGPNRQPLLNALHIGDNNTAPTSASVLTLNPLDRAIFSGNFNKFLTKGWAVNSILVDGKTNPYLSPNTVVTTFSTQKNTVNISPAANTGQGKAFGNTYNFIRPVDDYATRALINLWYSWVKYYQDKNTGTTQTINNLNVTQGGREITLNAPVAGLVPGMKLTNAAGTGPAPGLPAGTTIFALAKPLNITMGPGGTGYTQATTVVNFSGGGGSGATAVATVTGGAITNVTVTNSGHGYTSAPTISFGSPSGSGASATVALGPNATVLQLSLVATSTQAGQSYKFNKPLLTDILGNGEAQTYDISFNNYKPGPERDPLLFSQKVFQVMSAMSTIPQISGEGTPAFQEMFNVIGFNIGKVFLGQTPAIDPDSDVGRAINAQTRDALKSVMRGVTDFFTFTDQSKWYPAPGTQASDNQTGFNVFNLDPFVWFVHDVLNMSGYGFSVDDDSADVGADYANQLAMAVGSINGQFPTLKNQFEWTAGAPYGNVPTDRKPDGRDLTRLQATWNPAQPNVLTILREDIFFMFRPDDPNNGTFGAYVNGPGVNGQEIRLKDIGLLLQRQYLLTAPLKGLSAGPHDFTFSGKQIL